MRLRISAGFDWTNVEFMDFPCVTDRIQEAPGIVLRLLEQIGRIEGGFWCVNASVCGSRSQFKSLLKGFSEAIESGFVDTDAVLFALVRVRMLSLVRKHALEAFQDELLSLDLSVVKGDAVRELLALA